jgi:hypothetical protein
MQRNQMTLFGIKFGVVPEDGGRRPKRIGKDIILLYANTYDQIFGIKIRKITIFQAHDLA